MGYYQSKNPATGTTTVSFEILTAEDLKSKLVKSSNAFKDWKKTSLSYRQSLMFKLADLLMAKKENLANLANIEMGKLIPEGIAEIEKCVSSIKYLAKNAPHFLADKPIDTEASKSFITYQPLGTVLAIMPWNYPYWQVIRFAVPALLAGNTGLLKHASNVPQCALGLEGAFSEAGFPDGVFTNLFIDAKGCKQAIESDVVVAISLTGSEAAGKAIATLAGANLKKCVLELGGSDPFVVLANANLPAVAKEAVKARIKNAGQSCIAAKRFIVVAPNGKAFADLLATEMQLYSQSINDQKSLPYQLAPMASDKFAKDLFAQVSECVEMGAELICGQSTPPDAAFYKPSVLYNVKPGMPAWSQEFFGPVATVIEATSKQHAIEIANDTRFGLGASVWGDKSDAQVVANEIEAGSVFVNEIMKSDVRMPFGGIKNSGYGRELSEMGMLEFVNVKTIWVK